MSVKLANFTVISNVYAHYELKDKEGNAKVINRSIPAYLTACCKKIKDYQRWYTSAENYFARTGIALFSKTSNPYLYPNKDYVKGEYRNDKNLLNELILKNKSVKKQLRLSIHILKRAYGDPIKDIKKLLKKYIQLHRDFINLPQVEIVKKLTDNYVSIASIMQTKILEEAFLLVSLEEYPTKATLKNILKLLTSISDLQEKITERLTQINLLQTQIGQKVEEAGECTYQTEIEKLLYLNALLKELIEYKESIESCYKRVMDANVEPVCSEFCKNLAKYLAQIQEDFSLEKEEYYPVIHEVLSKMYETLSSMYSEEINKKAEVYGLYEYYCSRYIIIYDSHFRATDNLSEIQQKLLEVFQYISTPNRLVSEGPAASLLLQMKSLWEEFYNTISEHPQLSTQFEPYISSYATLLKLYNMNAIEEQHLEAMKEHHAEVMRRIPSAKRIAIYEKRIQDAPDSEGELVVLEQERLLCTHLEMSDHEALADSNDVCNQLTNCPKEFKSLYDDFLQYYSHLQKQAYTAYHEGQDLSLNIGKRKKLIVHYHEMYHLQTLIDEQLKYLKTLNAAQQETIQPSSLLELCKGMSFVLEHHDKIEHAKKEIKASSTNDNIFKLEESDCNYFNTVNKTIKKIENDLSKNGVNQNIITGHAVEILHKLFDALYAIYFEGQDKSAKTYDVIRYFYAKSYLICGYALLHGENSNNTEWLKEVNKQILSIQKYIDTTKPELLLNIYGRLYIQCKPLWYEFYEALKDTPQLAIHFQSYINAHKSLPLKCY